MNPLNHASLEASKRLADAGIVLMTESAWCRQDYHGHIFYHLYYKTLLREGEECIPAPSMAEVWRELPQAIKAPGGLAFLKVGKQHSDLDGCDYLVAEYSNQPASSFVRNSNPTDALIDLLIWLKGEA